MSVSEKMKAAAMLKGLQSVDVATRLGMTKAAYANKLARGSFAVDDALRVAGVLGLRLAFVDDLGRVVVAFDPEDAAPPRRSGQAASKEKE